MSLKSAQANIERRALIVLQEAWRTISEDELEKLQESLCQRALKSKAGHTKH